MHTDSTLSLAIMQRPFTRAAWWKPLALCLGSKVIGFDESFSFQVDLVTSWKHIMEMSWKAWWAMKFAYLWNSEVGKHSIFFQVLIHIDAVLGPVHCQFVGNVYWCLKVRQCFCFWFFVGLLSLCGCVMVLWRVWWHVCKFLCINLWFKYPC
jgi:hypothetical protein